MPFLMTERYEIAHCYVQLGGMTAEKTEKMKYYRMASSSFRSLCRDFPKMKNIKKQFGKLKRLLFWEKIKAWFESLFSRIRP